MNPKRYLTPGDRQPLITSTFSPKVNNLSKRHDEEDKETLDTARDLSEENKEKGC